MSGQQADQQAAEGVEAEAGGGVERDDAPAQGFRGFALQHDIGADVAHGDAEADHRHGGERQRQHVATGEDQQGQGSNGAGGEYGARQRLHGQARGQQHGR